MNMILFLRYKSYFFYQELVNIINEETVNLNQIKDKSLNCDENLINKIFDSLLEIFSSKNDFYKKDVADEITYNLDNINILEIATNRIDYKGISIIYPEFFDIVDGTIYNDLIMRLNIEKIGFVKCELIINKGIIIIKNEENNNGFYLLIGKIIEDNRFELKNLIIFDEEKYRKEFFENFLKNSYEEIMEKYNLEKNENPIYFNGNIMNFNERHIGDKMIKLFLFLFLFDLEINNIIKDDIKNNETRFFYLINKKWMKIYKDHYDYNKLLIQFNNMKKKSSFNKDYKQLKEFIKSNNVEKINEISFQLIKNIPLDILTELEDKKKSQYKLKENNNYEKLILINKKYKSEEGDILIYHGENEIISDELFELFNKIETNFVKNSLKNASEKIECLIGENQLFIKSKTKKENSKIDYYVINVGNIHSNIFYPSLLIYFNKKENFDKIISYFMTKSFSEFFRNCDLLDQWSFDTINSNSENVGKICKIDSLPDELRNIIEDPFYKKSQSSKLLQLIIYLKQFEKIKNSKIKPNQELDVFYIGRDYINKMKNMNNYNLIKNYINKNSEIQAILNNNSNKNIGVISDLIIEKFDIKTIIKINEGKTKDKIENYDKQNNSQSVTINKGFDINFINNFYLLNKEMYILLKEGFYFEYEYFIGENKIFVPKVKQKAILVYNINDNNEINLELILCFDNSFDSFLRQIKENGFKKFKELNIFEKDEISPIFDTNNKKIGVAFKYFPYKNYYGGLKFCFGMRKMFILYLNYKKLEKEKNNSFDQYYIVNKRWIEKYKNYYDFDTIYKEIDKNCDMKSIINNLKEKDEGDIIISDKNLILMLKKLPKEM